MQAFPSLSITSSTPFTFNPFVGKSARQITYLEVQVLTGSTDVYVGPYPNVPTLQQTIVFSIAAVGARTSQNASSWIETTDGVVKGRHQNIMPGWVVTACSVPAHVGRYVTQVDGDLLIFDQALTADDTQTMTLAAPYYANITNGFVLSAGLWKSWTAEKDSAFLSEALRFSVSSGTGLINIQYAFA